MLVSHLTLSTSYHVTLSLDPLLVVETSPESLITSPNNQFSINCTARAEVDGEPLNVTIEWTRLFTSNDSLNTSNIDVEALTEDQTDSTHNTSTVNSYQSVLTTSENDTVNPTIYRCIATTSNYSAISDTTVFIEGI